jgi:hypothetical protein
MDPAQLKASYDQTQYLTDMVGKVDTDLLKSQNYQNVEGLKSQYNQTKDILDTQDRAQYANENRQNRNFQLLNDNIKDQSAGLSSTIYRTASNADNNLYRTTSEIDANIYRTTSQTDQTIYRTSQDTRARIAEQMSSVAAGIAQTQLEGQKSTNELLGYIKTNNDINWSHFGDLTKDIYQGKAETILSNTNQYAILAKQASDNTSAIQMEALKNKGDLAKQMAFEYSSLKDKIADSEASIKSVLSTQESDRLRDALRSTEHKSLYFELKDRHHHGHRRHHH